MQRLNRASLQAGQAVVVVVVGMVIALTIGLSIAARSIINLQQTTEEEISQRAFSAAEAGIERALTSNENLSNFPLDNNARIKDVKVNEVDTKLINGQDHLLLNDGIPILADDPIDVWLSIYPNYTSPRTGTLNIYWGAATECSEAAIEVVAVTGSRQTPTISRTVYDPCAARRATNSFSAPSSGTTVDGRVLNYGVSLAVNSGLIVRIVPLYHNTTVGIIPAPGLDLPPQGSRIESVGESGDTQRKITVYRGYPKIPYEFFPNVIFSL